MKLIKGDDLNQTQTEQVLSAFIYRWTSDNNARERVWANISKPTIPLVSDNQWLKDHAFWFINDGSRLATRHHAEPVYMSCTITSV
jgi:hypothetical protein